MGIRFNFNFDLLIEKVKEFGCNKWSDFELHPIIDKQKFKRVSFTVDGVTSLLNVFTNDDGTITVQETGPKSGYQLDIINLVSDLARPELNEKAKLKSIKAQSHSLPLSIEIFDEVISLLRNIDGYEVVHKEVASPPHVSYQFSKGAFEKLTLNFYFSGRPTKLVIQGKPNYLYFEILTMLSKYPNITIHELIHENEMLDTTNLTPEVVRSDLSTHFPSSYSKLDEILIKVVTPSLALSKVPLELEDYSPIVQPACRALEMTIFKLLQKVNIIIDEKNEKLGDLFEYLNYEHVVNENSHIWCRSTQDDDVKRQLGACYTHFCIHRHPISHAKQLIDSTKIIESKEEALRVVFKTIELIDNGYKLV